MQPFERDRPALARFRCGAAQYGAHAGQHFAHGERLGDIVVGSDVESRDRVVLGVFGRAEDDRHGGRFGLRSEQPGHLESAHLAHHDVEQNQRIAFGVHAEGLFGAVRRIDFVTLDFEIELKNLAEGFLVVHHKDFVLCHNCYGLVSASKVRNNPFIAWSPPNI